MSGTGRWRVVVYQYESNGTQQTSVAIFDEGQTATLKAGKTLRIKTSPALGA
jgi:hypothetical protein